MAKKKEPKPAAVPNATALTQAQTDASRTAARESSAMNNIDQVGPNGSVTFERDANGVPIRQVTTLAPGAQQALDAQNSLSSGLSNTALGMLGNLPTTPFGMPSDLPDWITGLDESKLTRMPGSEDNAAARDSYSKAMFDRGMSLLRPEFESQDRKTEQYLSDRGLPITGEAYEREKNRVRMGQDDAMGRLAMDSVAAGAGEQSRIFGLDLQSRNQGVNEQLTGGQFANETRNNMLGEALGMYNQPLDQISRLLGASPQTQGPNALPFAQYGITPGDIAGNTWNSYNAQEQQRQQQIAQNNAFWNNLASIGGSAAQVAMMSDENMKEDIGEADAVFDDADTSFVDRVEALPIKSWRYKPEAGQDGGEKHVGPMAQDFKGFFGLGDGKSIPIVDAFGVTLKATQQLAKKVKQLEKAA
ncbi:MAG: tail fiber domain-containing protein [Desulfurellales bacterium]|nr:MAG: tail fiber domain-containing protein [Desulfurellales bacterium]